VEVDVSRAKVTQKTSQVLLTELKGIVDEEKLTAYDVSFSNDDVVFPKHVYSFRHFLHDNQKQIFQDYNDLPDKDTESDAKSLYNITLKACGYLYARYTISESKKYLEIIDSIPKESKEFDIIVAYYKEAQTKQAEASQKRVQDPPGSGQGPPVRDLAEKGSGNKKKEGTTNINKTTTR